jgi:dihydroorotate dehydrogenase electron transfer subunit
MPKTILDFQILDNKRLKKDFFILELIASSSLPEILPGQFVQVRIDGSADTFLRRPLSVYDIDYDDNTIRLLVQVVGKGTEKLSTLKKGDVVNVLFPLGNSFTMPAQKERVLLVGGGVGLAPFLLFGKRLQKMKCDYEPDILLGFRNMERIIDYKEFLQYGKVHITTEDGSAGEKGFVTNHSILDSERFDRIYCCGPDPMMKAVAAYARTNNIFCEVSLENLMACGFGICLCCIAETTRGNICTCTEGPVFNVNELKW